MNAPHELAVKLGVDATALVVLRFTSPQHPCHSYGKRVGSPLPPDDPASLALELMGRKDECAAEIAQREVALLCSPIVVFDLRGSTFVNTYRLGQIVLVRNAAAAKGGRCLALVDDLDQGAARTLTVCGLKRLVELVRLP